MSSDVFKEHIEKVKRANPIAEVIGETVDLHQCGEELVGRSPFYEDHNPSLSVNPVKGGGLFLDRAGGEEVGGDVIRWTELLHDVDFTSALKILEERAGIPPFEESGEDAAQRAAEESQRRDDFWVLDELVHFFHRTMPDDIRTEFYKGERNYTDETIDDHLFGFCGVGRDGNGSGAFTYLTQTLGISRERALRCGAFHVMPNGDVVDRYPGRLIIPFLINGAARYITARKTRFTPDAPWENAKYLKLPGRDEKHPYISPFIRNDVFYGEDSIAHAVDTAVIAEGPLDGAAVHQCGLPCLAPGSTRFREVDHPKLVEITRRAKRVVFCYDTDGAGRKGALAEGSRLYEDGREVAIASLSEGIEKTDICDYCRTHSPEQFREIIANAQDIIRYQLDRIPNTTTGKQLDDLLKEIFEPLISRSSIERDHFTKLAARRFKIRQAAIRDLFKEIAAKKKKVIKGSDTSGKQSEITIRGAVQQASNYYFVRHEVVDKFTREIETETEILSSFAIEPVRRVMLQGEEHVFADIVTDSGVIHRDHHFAPGAFNSKRDLRRALPFADAQFTGDDDQVQGVLRRVAAYQIPTFNGVSVVGFHQTPQGLRWIAPGTVLGPNGIDTSSEVVFVDDGSPFPSRLRYTLPSLDDTKKLARVVYPALVAVNTPAIIFNLIAWFHAAPMRQLIMSVLGHFPSLFIAGTFESGKTTTIQRIFWPLSGIPDVASAAPFSVSATKFSLIKLMSSSNGVPIFYDEYRPMDMDPRQVNLVHRLLRQNYAQEAEERGAKDLSVKEFGLLAPTAVAGECFPADPALIDRTVQLRMDKNVIHIQKHTSAFERVVSYPLSDLAAPYLVYLLSQNGRENLEAAFDTADTIISGMPSGKNLSIRYRDNLRVLVFGFSMWEAFAAKLGVPLGALDLESALEATAAEAMTGTKGAKNMLDVFLEDLATMAHAGAIEFDKHYTIIDADLRIYLRPCWAKYMEFRQRIGEREGTNGLDALQRMLAENLAAGGYVRDLSIQTPMGKTSPRMVAIHFETASQTLDLSGFPTHLRRSWGGARKAAGDDK